MNDIGRIIEGNTTIACLSAGWFIRRTPQHERPDENVCHNGRASERGRERQRGRQRESQRERVRERERGKKTERDFVSVEVHRGFDILYRAGHSVCPPTDERQGESSSDEDCDGAPQLHRQNRTRARPATQMQTALCLFVSFFFLFIQSSWLPIILSKEKGLPQENAFHFVPVRDNTTRHDTTRYEMTDSQSVQTRQA